MNRRKFFGGILGAGAAGLVSTPFIVAARGDTAMRLWSNGCDYVVASDVAGARQVVAEAYDYDLPLSEEQIEEIDWEGWSAYASEQELELLVADRVVSKPVSAWIEESGAGYLACTEY